MSIETNKANDKLRYHVIKKGSYLFRADDYGKYYGAIFEIVDQDARDLAIANASRDLLRSPAWFGDLAVTTNDYLERVGVALRTVTDGPLPRL